MLVGFATAESYWDMLQTIADKNYGDSNGELTFDELLSAIEAEGGDSAEFLKEIYGEDFDWAAD